MLEDKDIQKLKEELVTKEDLREFSIRAFESFATKEDIKELKQDITGLREQIQALTISGDG